MFSASINLHNITAVSLCDIRLGLGFMFHDARTTHAVLAVYIRVDRANRDLQIARRNAHHVQAESSMMQWRYVRARASDPL